MDFGPTFNFRRALGCFCHSGGHFVCQFLHFHILNEEARMPSLTLSNELISRDEGIHTDFTCFLFSHLKWCPHPDVIRQIIAGAIKIEQGFLAGKIFENTICWLFLDALPAALIRMNAKLMRQYIEFVADHLLISLGNDKVYNITSPFDIHGYDFFARQD